MLGMTALFMGKDYRVESNRESGYGRFDLAIIPKDVAKAGVIMEFKVASSEADMAAKAKEALQQIEEREYVTEFRQRGIQRVACMEIWYHLLREKNPCISRANVLNYSSIGFE